MRRLMLTVAILMLGGCAGTPQANLTQIRDVLVMVRADAHTALVMGCNGLPAKEVALSVVQPFLAAVPDPKVQEGVAAAQAGVAIANALCAQVLAAESMTPTVMVPYGSAPMQMMVAP